MNDRPKRTTRPRRRLGAVTPAAEERVATMLAKMRGQGRATIRDRMAAARWLVEAGFGPPPEGDPTQLVDPDEERPAR